MTIANDSVFCCGVYVQALVLYSQVTNRRRLRQWTWGSPMKLPQDQKVMASRFVAYDNAIAFMYDDWTQPEHERVRVCLSMSVLSFPDG